ncbi:MAG: trypsin-like peptidase domain-containing protein [Planctomycetota bacterium]
MVLCLLWLSGVLLGAETDFPPVPQADVYAADPYREDLSYRSEVEQALALLETDSAADSARLALHDLLETYPKSPVLRYEWGCQQAQQGRWDKAAREWALAADADGGRSGVTVRALEGIATVQTHQGRKPEALDTLRRLTSVMPLAYAAWNRLGTALEAAGQKEKAREAWEASLLLNPTQQDVARRLGRRAAADRTPDDLPKLLRRLRPSVVLVKTDAGHLTGFLALRHGWIVTAAHGFRGDERSVEVTRFADGKDPVKSNALLAFRDSARDVALVYCKDLPEELPRLPLRSVEGLEAGERLYTLGNPGFAEEVLSLSPSEGIFAGVRKREDEPTLLQCNMAVNPGNSGGPLFDRWGRCLGIVVAKTSLEGVAFAVEAGQLAEALSEEGPLHAPPVPK